MSKDTELVIEHGSARAGADMSEVDVSVEDAEIQAEAALPQSDASKDSKNYPLPSPEVSQMSPPPVPPVDTDDPAPQQ